MRKTNGWLVAVVDDDRDLLDVVSELLREEGYEVRGFSDPREALSYFNNGAGPCVILLDVLMPGMSGVELLEELRQRGRRDPAIIMTASRRHQGDLLKPFSVEVLLETVAEVIMTKSIPRQSIERRSTDPPLTSRFI